MAPLTDPTTNPGTIHCTFRPGFVSTKVATPEPRPVPALLLRNFEPLMLRLDALTMRAPPTAPPLSLAKVELVIARLDSPPTAKPPPAALLLAGARPAADRAEELMARLFVTGMLARSAESRPAARE